MAAPRFPKLHIYRDKGKKKGWRWRLLTANGRLVADSGESYTRRMDAARAAQRLFTIVPRARMVVDEI